MREKIVVTGGLGFIGSHYIKYLLRTYNDIEVYNLDKITYAADFKNLSEVNEDKRYKFIELDIYDSNKVSAILEDIRPHYIVHFAAESMVDRSNDKNCADEFVKTNIVGTYNLLKALNNASIRGLEKFVYISTDEYYGSVSIPSKETDRPIPSSVYSWSKACGDLAMYPYIKTHSLPIVVTRSSNNYGPNQNVEKLIPLAITNLLAGKKVPLYGDGKNRRDWIYVEDNVKAIDTVRLDGKVGESYNIGTGKTYTNIQIIKMILELMELDEKMIEYVKDRPGHDRKYAVNTEKIEKLGWKPNNKLKDGLRRTIEFYKN